jgi:hypothetical protein
MNKRKTIPRLNTGNTTKCQYKDINNVAFYAAISTSSKALPPRATHGRVLDAASELS